MVYKYVETQVYIPQMKISTHPYFLSKSTHAPQVEQLRARQFFPRLRLGLLRNRGL